MDVEVELALQVVAAELAKVCFVPDDGGRFADFVETRPTGEQGIDYRRDVFQVLLDELALRRGEESQLHRSCAEAGYDDVPGL